MTNNIFLCVKIGQTKSTVERGQTDSLPLYKVGCIFDYENIYINNQVADSPDQIDWNLENRKSWINYMDKSVKSQYFADNV